MKEYSLKRVKCKSWFDKNKNLYNLFLKNHFNYYDVPSLDGTHYWQNNYYYEFSYDLIEKVKTDSKELHYMCMDFIEDVVVSGNYPSQYNFSNKTKELIEQSFRHSYENAFYDNLYGRFDLAINVYDNKPVIKMIEYNADTPTSLLEASRIQNIWKEYKKFNHFQFNDIEFKLAERWKNLIQKLVIDKNRLFNICLAAENYQNENREDYGNLKFMLDVLNNVIKQYFNDYKIETSIISMLDIGYDYGMQDFVDLKNQRIDLLFKLYPWEYIVDEQFYEHYELGKTQFIEPIWKMLLSNKCLSVELWNRNKNHPLLLEASYFNNLNKRHIKKAKLAREGANIFIQNEKVDNLDENDNGYYELDSQCDAYSDYYDSKGYIYQEYFEMQSFDGFVPIYGSWMIGGECAGLGIREDLNKITSNDSHFVSHLIY